MHVSHLQKNKERIWKYKEEEDLRYIYQNELDKAYFQLDISLKELTRRTASDKILHNKAFNIAKYPNYDGCHRDLVSMVYKVSNKEFDFACR